MSCRLHSIHRIQKGAWRDAKTRDMLNVVSSCATWANLLAKTLNGAARLGKGLQCQEPQMALVSTRFA